MHDVRRLQAFLRTAPAAGREVVRSGPFTAYFDPHDELRFLNYAIPDDGARPGTRTIDRLRVHFRERRRLPRLEWIEEAAPDLAAALAAGGMREELRTPLMTCAPDELVDATADVPGLTLEPVDDGDARTCANVQRRAFGDRELGDGEPAADPRRHGGGAILARSNGVPVAAAGWTAVVDGVSEIVGVATEEIWRRRGLAGATTAAATREAFAAGAELCLLSPGDEVALRVYARAGFRRVATMLHWSDPV
jgi:GNAT superfamily N-acetyltransferase